METALVDGLFGLIKFDMEQIQRYREAILSISSLSILASFAISAFIYGQGNNRLDVRIGRNILIWTELGILLILSIMTVSYFKGLNFSRAALEMREDAIRCYVRKHKPIDENSLYPNPEAAKYEPKRQSRLEKLPLLLSIGLIFVKALIEIRIDTVENATFLGRNSRTILRNLAILAAVVTLIVAIIYSDMLPSIFSVAPKQLLCDS